MHTGERAAWLSAALFLAFGCGGSSPQLPPAAAEASQLPAAAVGGRPPSESAAPRRAGPASSTGQGRFTVRALVDGRPVPARVRVLDSDLEGDSGTELTISAGTHRIEVKISDVAAMADLPAQIQEVFIASGKETQVDAVFPWSRVQLSVVSGGQTRAGAPIKLLRNGAVVAESRSGGQITISPGKYEADVTISNTTIRVRGLQFLESATQNVPVRVQF